MLLLFLHVRQSTAKDSHVLCKQKTLKQRYSRLNHRFCSALPNGKSKGFIFLLLQRDRLLVSTEVWFSTLCLVWFFVGFFCLLVFFLFHKYILSGQQIYCIPCFHFGPIHIIFLPETFIQMQFEEWRYLSGFFQS